MTLYSEGDKVTVSNVIDLRPHTLLNAGEGGVVVFAGVNPFLDDYVVEVRMDKHHKGLDEWGNRALLAYPDVASLSLHKRERLPIGDVANNLAAAFTAVGIWGYECVVRALL